MQKTSFQKYIIVNLEILYISYFFGRKKINTQKYTTKNSEKNCEKYFRVYFACEKISILIFQLVQGKIIFFLRNTNEYFFDYPTSLYFYYTCLYCRDFADMTHLMLVV